MANDLDKKVVLSIDLGTGGPKIAMVNLRGDVLCCEHRRIPTNLTDDGGATQDTSLWWRAIKESTHRLLAQNVCKPDQIMSVSTTGMWGSTVAIDENLEACAPCILWMDTRGHKYSRDVLKGVGPFQLEGYGLLKVYKFISKTAGAPALQGNDPLGQILFLKNEMPDSYNRAKFFIEPVDYISTLFTGEVRSTPASMILSWLIDLRKLDNPHYCEDLIKITTREKIHLPPLVPNGSVVGHVKKSVSDELGIPAGIPVIAGTPDLLSACTGSGALEDYEMHMAISTTSWISCHVSKKKTDPFKQIATVPGVMPNRYLLANNHETAGICLEWAKDTLMRGPFDLMGVKSEISYEDLNSIIEKIEPGSNGVIFAPWLKGERCPVDDRTLRASFLNMSLSTSPGDFIRSVYEGVALNARWMLDAVTQFVKRPTKEIRLIGGGAQSDTWCQIHADIMDVKILKIRDPLYANVRGAALYAGLSLGEIGPDEVKLACKVEREFEPDRNNKKIYELIYQEFKNLYKQQAKMYKRLNSRKI